MSQNSGDFDYDIDLNNLEDDEDIEVERIGAQKEKPPKEPKQKKAPVEKKPAAPKPPSTQQQQQHAASNINNNNNQRKIDEAFRTTQQQKIANSAMSISAPAFDIDAALGRLKNSSSNDDDGADFMASLLTDENSDDDDDEYESLDINAILGLKPVNETKNSNVITTEDAAAPAPEEDYFAASVKIEDDANSNNKSNKKNNVFTQIKKEDNVAAAMSGGASPGGISTAATVGSTSSTTKQNFVVANAPEMRFVNNNNNTSIDVKKEVKMEDVKFEVKVEADDGDAISQSVQESSSAAAGSASAMFKKLSPPIQPPQDRQTKVPTVAELSGSIPIVLRNVYWFDAKEALSHDEKDLAGSVLLFGRIRVRENDDAKYFTWKSICVRVPMKRTLLFLPKRKFSAMASDEERNQAKTSAILELHNFCRSRATFGNEKTLKWVQRRYAFEEAGVPTEETEWLKLKYSGAHPPLWRQDDAMPKFDNFSHVFGVQRSLMELLFIESRFEGPGFLDITNAAAVPVSRRHSICAFEFTAGSQEDVFVLTKTEVEKYCPRPPELTAASLCIRAQLDESGKKHEIYAAALAVCRFDTETASPKAPDCAPFIGLRQWANKSNDDKLPFDLIKKAATNRLGDIHTFADERDLLKWLLKLIRDQDPDIIIGHNIVGFSLGLLFSRIDELNIPRVMPDWSSLGRMHFKSVPHRLGANRNAGQKGSFGNNTAADSSSNGYWEKEVCAGRLLVDTYNLAREHHKTNNYKLLSLANELQLSGIFGPVLESHVEQPPTLLNPVRMKNSDELLTILGQDYNFALLCVLLTHKLGLVPLTKRLTVVAGTVWSRVLNGSRAERIEYLLMHAFHRLKFVTPDKSGMKQRLALQKESEALEKQEQQIARDKENFAQNDEQKNNVGAKKSTAGAVRRQRPNANATAVAAAAADAFEDQVEDDDEAVDAEGHVVDEDEDALQEDGAAGGGSAGAGGNGVSASSKKTAKYKGGRVLEPQVGLYRDYVLLLDFNSLYPSLIQEFNVCFTTVNRLKGAAALRDRNEPQIPQREALICECCIKLPNAESLYPCPHRCILPKVIRDLVEGRKAVRRLMKTERNPAAYAQLNIRQMALKLTANSMYGCLGFEHSRFYAQKLAELVTLQGRNALTKTVEIVNSYPGQIKVVYGDTDSVMISTKEFENLDNVRRIAANLQKEVNKRYKHLELGMDGVFRSLLLHKKKKYAALTVVDYAGAGKEFKQEVKGLEMVRRDWCKLSKQACAMVLKTALDPKLTDSEEVVDTIGAGLEKIADSILGGHEPLSSYVIAKSITRAPEAYKDANTQPHVQVALRMKQRKLPVSVGDLIPYVICSPQQQEQQPAQTTTTNNNTNDKNDKSAKVPPATSTTHLVKQLAQKAFSQDEVNEKKLAVDAEWYLANQIYPPVLRLCEHIEGFTQEFLVSKLKISKASVGLNENSSSLNNPRGGAGGNNADAANRSVFAVTFKGMTLEEAYPGVPPLTVKCLRCGEIHRQQPHTYASEILNEKHPRFGMMFPRLDLSEKNKVIERRWFAQGQLERVPWFYCRNGLCPDPFFGPAVVENAIIGYLDRAVSNFYAPPNARSDMKYKKLLDQVSYIQRLIEIPAAPMEGKQKSLWDRAARFVDLTGKWRSAEEVRSAQRDTHKTFAGDEDFIRVRDEKLYSKLVGKEALDRFLPLLPALRVDFALEFFTEEEDE